MEGWRDMGTSKASALCSPYHSYRAASQSSSRRSWVSRPALQGRQPASDDSELLIGSHLDIPSLPSASVPPCPLSVTLSLSIPLRPFSPSLSPLSESVTLSLRVSAPLCPSLPLNLWPTLPLSVPLCPLQVLSLSVPPVCLCLSLSLSLTVRSDPSVLLGPRQQRSSEYQTSVSLPGLHDSLNC